MGAVRCVPLERMLDIYYYYYYYLLMQIIQSLVILSDGLSFFPLISEQIDLVLVCLSTECVLSFLVLRSLNDLCSCEFLAHFILVA